MSFRRFILAVSLLASPLAFAGSTTASAAESCTCSNITMQTGYCTQYVCHPIFMSSITPKPIRSLKACPTRHQMLYCDGGSCTVTCDTAMKTTQQQ